MKIQVQTRDIKNFKTSMYEHTLHRGTKHFCRYCLQAFSTAQKLKYHVKDCFKIYSKQTIIMPQKDDCIKFKNFGRKIKSPFMIHAAIEAIQPFQCLKIMERKIQMNLTLTNMSLVKTCYLQLRLVLWLVCADVN